ncbi:Centromere/kinetochore Zw10-domain-containing protein [Hyaloraphidium curvatum]|nr:Centromere/kinetochore Zw10-domain-containing protein [Hyaloraphidium curvatum]
MDVPRRRPGSLAALILATLAGETPDPALLEEPVSDGALREERKPREPDRAEMKLAIADLDEEIARIEAEIASIVEANRGILEAEHAESVARHERVTALVSEIEQVANTLEDPETGVRAELEALLQQHRTLRKEIEEAKELVNVMDRLVEWQALHSVVLKHLDTGDYAAAARSHLDLCEKLSLLVTLCEGAKVLTWVREDTEEAGTLLEARLEEQIAVILVFVPSGFEIRDSKAFDGVLEALDILGAASARHHLAPFTRGLSKSVLGPMVERKMQADVRSNGVFVRERIDADGFQIGDLYRSILDLTTYMHDTMFAKSATFFCSILGSSIWDGLAASIAKHWLEPRVPTSAVELASFGEVEEATGQFMARLISQSFVPEGDPQNALLTDFCRDVETRFVEGKRRSVLKQARTLIIGKHEDVRWDVKDPGELFLPVPSIVAETGAPEGARPQSTSPSPPNGFHLTQQDLHPSLLQPLFAPPPCTISSLAPALLDLVAALLAEAAASSSARCTRELVKLARGIPRLYRAIKAADREPVPVLAARTHNDCHYLASGLEALGSRWSGPMRRGPGKGYEVAEHATIVTSFADEAAELRRAGVRALNLSLCAQKDELAECLSSAGGWEMPDEDKAADSARAAKQAVHLLGRLGRVWKEVLPSGVFLRCLGLMVDEAAAAVIAAVEDVRDIGADESARMCKVIDDLHAGLIGVFSEALRGLVPASENESSEAGAETARRLAPNVDKLSLLARLLDSSFAKIMDMFREGRLRGFALPELTGLVRAVFADTALRQRNLEEILRGHPAQ